MLTAHNSDAFQSLGWTGKDGKGGLYQPDNLDGLPPTHADLEGQLPDDILLAGLHLQDDSSYKQSICKICLEETTFSTDLSPCDCGCVYCTECLSTYVSGKIQRKEWPFWCPMNTHRLELTTAVIKSLELSEAERNKLIGVKAPPIVPPNVRGMTCPVCNTIVRDNGTNNAKDAFLTCSLDRCGYRWCKDCDGKVFLSESRSGVKVRHRCFESFHELVRQNGWRPCPGCGVVVEKIEGCNHIKCPTTGCSVHFCWRCGQLIIDESEGGNVVSTVAQHNPCKRPVYVHPALETRSKCNIQ